MSNLPRNQHMIASGFIALIGISVSYVSYTQEPSDAFLFPRLISTFFVILALWTFGKAVLGRTKVGDGLGLYSFRKILPGLIVALILVYWAAEALGFYSATAISFFAILSLFDPAPHTKIKSWIKRIVITIGFLVVMYCLFAMLLSVFTPRGIFF